MFKYVIVAMLMVAVGLWGYIIGSVNPRVTSTDHTVTEEICKYKDINLDWQNACSIAREMSEIKR